MFYFLVPVLVALGVEGVEVRVHVGLADEDDEVILGESPAVVLGQALDGREVILRDLDVVVPAEVQVLRDGQRPSVRYIRLVKNLLQSYKYVLTETSIMNKYISTCIIVDTYIQYSHLW